MNKNIRVAVLMGGWNSERAVSLVSGEAVYQSLLRLGFEAVKIDFSRDIYNQIQKVKPDVVFNALHGKYGEDGRIQGFLDILEIPYTHSNVAACAICMDKVLTREVCSNEGVKFPEYGIIKKGDDAKNLEILSKIGKPFVIKPLNEGSSFGIEVFLSDAKFDIDSYEWRYGDKMIVERYLSGQEVHVAIMGGKALGTVEVKIDNVFFDYKCKYTPGMAEFIVPAEISDEKSKEVMDLALKCYDAVGCSGITRVDFILNNKNGGDDNFYLLEVNSHPGFTTESLLPKIAKNAGISFDDIVNYLIESASCGS